MLPLNEGETRVVLSLPLLQLNYCIGGSIAQKGGNKMSNAFMRKDKKSRMKTDTMVKVGLMIALSVVLKLVT